MRWEQLAGVTGAGAGSGYLIAPRLVLTSAHVVGENNTEVTVLRPGRLGEYSAKVAWCGRAGGIDDAALVEVHDPAWKAPQMRPVIWGRVVTQQPGIKCRTWGLPDFIQREGTSTDTEQPTGTLNPGDGYGRQHILHLIEHPPTALGESPWKGISGAAAYCGSLLTGVVATDPAHRDHAALGVVPAYVLLAQPGFREVVEQHCGTAGLQWAPVELQELADHQSPTRAATTPGTPATLLTARRAVVEFRGRDHLLNELRDWADEPGVGAWLIHGAGGQGKTRLAHHLGAELAAQRWSVLWLDPAIVTAEQLGVLGQVVTPLLVIIDYAEARVPQTGTLFAELVTHVGDRPVKVLLLARTVGEWWTQLSAVSDAVGDVTACARVTALPPLNDGPEAREATYRDTVRAMAATLPVLGDPTTAKWKEAAHRVLTQPYRDLGDNTTVLGVQMNALADLLDIGHDSSPPPIGRQSLEDRVLEHEHRYWTATATRDALDSLGMATLKDALVATIVLAATTSKELEKALARIPDLTDQPRLTRTKVQTWLMSLYPGDTDGIYAGPTPDRLAEQLVGRSMLDLTRDSVVESLAAIIDEVEAEHLLTVCTRATAHPSLMPAAGESLTEICVNYPDMLLPAAVRIAPQVESPAPLIAALDRVGIDSRVGIDLLDKLLEAIPSGTQVLAAPAITIGNALIARLKNLAGTEAADRVKLATVLGKTAQWQRRKDRLGDALASATEAAAIHRELDGTQQVDQLAGLAKTLTTQAAVLGDLRRYDQSLPAATEAVEIFRGLFGRDPETHLIDFVAALYVLTLQMRESGQGAAALGTASEGIVMVRSLVEEQRSSTARSRLAACLIAVGAEHHTAERHTKALEAGAEALDIYRELANSRPDAYVAEHAMALNNMSIFLSAAGRHGDAIQSIEESIAIHRDLATKYPDGNLSYLGSSLYTLAAKYIEQNQFDKAYSPACESLKIFRQLAEVNVEAYEPRLGACLHNFAYILIELNRASEAREPAVQAVDIHRRLSGRNLINDPGVLATCLNTLGRIQERAGQLSLALGSVTEAVELQRGVAEDSQSSRSNLAELLTNVARYRGKAGLRSAGLDAIAEALTIYERLIIESPGTYDALLDEARRVRDKFDR